MFGLDDYLVSLSSGSSILIVVLVATLLGLRHAPTPTTSPRSRRSLLPGRNRLDAGRPRSARGGASATR